MDKHQILEQLQHIIAVYNQLLRAAGMPSDMRDELNENIDAAEAMYKKLANREVIDFKHLMNR